MRRYSKYHGFDRRWHNYQDERSYQDFFNRADDFIEECIKIQEGEVPRGFSALGSLIEDVEDWLEDYGTPYEGRLGYVEGEYKYVESRSMGRHGLYSEEHKAKEIAGKLESCIEDIFSKNRAFVQRRVD